MTSTVKYYFDTTIEKGYAFLGLFFAMFKESFAKYIFNDWDFVVFLFVAIILDTFFAVIHVIKTEGWRGLSLKQSERFLIKIFLYFGVLVLSHILSNFTIHGKPNNLFSWIDSFLYSYIIVKEGISVAVNINKVSPSTISTEIINRMKKFTKSGNASDLIDDNEPKTN